jgi:hypothetical protein
MVDPEEDMKEDVGACLTAPGSRKSSPTVSPASGFDPSRERPSAHGAILGEALSDLAKAGAVGTDLLSVMCSTCAFREGCMSNQMAATGVEALNIVLGIDDADFGCHHGMKDGFPTRFCAGAAAAKRAPFSVLQSALRTLNSRLELLPESDAVRADFDAWVARHDPGCQLDDYQRARLFARDSGSRSQSRDPEEGLGPQAGRAAEGIAR